MVDVWQRPKYTSIYEWLLNIFCILEFGSINMSRQVRSCRKIIRDDENRAFVFKINRPYTKKRNEDIRENPRTQDLKEDSITEDAEENPITEDPREHLPINEDP